MVEQFVDRARELQWLESYSGDKSSLLVLYGRRRVGKTELLKKFMKDKPHIYFLATKRIEPENMRDLQKQLANYLGDKLFQRAHFERWEELFEVFITKVDEPLVIAIDEFPYLIEVNRAIPSIFQKIWDELLSSSTNPITLILCGSSIGMMETHVLGYKSPLYGRRDGQWKLQPFRFEQLSRFFPNTTFEERLKFYSIADGIPQYLQCLSATRSPKWNLKHRVLSKGSYLYEEALNLLVQEFRRSHNYFSILQAIAEGNTKYGNICTRTGFSKPKVSQYLNNLRELHVVKREFPVTQKKESRNAQYRLSDHYFNFWFQFVYPNLSMLEEGNVEAVMANEQERFRRHVSFTFEEVCRQYLQNEWDEVGRWWRKGEEIDIIGLRRKGKRVLFGECKWSKKLLRAKVLKRLFKKRNLVNWSKDNEAFILFSRSGFTKQVIDLSDQHENVRLVAQQELEQHFRCER